MILYGIYKLTKFSILMKKLIFTAAAALTMTFAANAQVGDMPMRIDRQHMQVMPRAFGETSPKHIQTGLVTKGISNDCLFDAADGHANAFAFCIFDYRFKTNALVNFTTDKPLDYEMQKDYQKIPGESYGFFSSTFVGDKIFAYCYKFYGPGMLIPSSLGYIDPKTGEYTAEVEMPTGYTRTLDDMSYDPETNKVFAHSINLDQTNKHTESTSLLMIDMNDSKKAIKELAVIKDVEIYTSSVDRGYMYCIVADRNLANTANKNCHLIRISLESLMKGEPVIEELNKKQGLGIEIGYSQTMEFDKNTHRLWWIAGDMNGKGYFVEIDPEQGKTISKTEYSANCQFVSLAMPYQKVSKEAPSYITEFNCKAAEKGEGKVSLSWKNPSVNWNLDAVSSLSDVKIYRDGELIKTVAATGAGQAQSFEDTNVASGNHIYKVLVSNAAGDGLYKDVRLFVGRDVPAKVSNLKLTAEDCNATLTWEAPTVGKNGGWIDAASLKYDVVRMPDNKVIATDITETKITDTVTEAAGYSYKVTVKNADGTGEEAVSNIVSFGPSTSIPFFSAMNTKAEFDKWTIIDNNNDMTSWQFTNNTANYERAEGAADDYLVSPKLTFEDGKLYEIRFTYWTMNWVDFNQNPIMEKMDISYAQDPTVENLKNGVIQDLGEFHTPSETFLHTKQVFSAKPGAGYLAFHAKSDADRSIIYIKDICIREYSATDLSVTDLKGSATVVEGTEEVFGVEVTNEGSQTVSEYTIDLINSETGEVFASEKGAKVDSQSKVIVPVKWTPAKSGEFKLTARVNLEGDTYTADNTWTEPLNVKVSPAGSDKWMTVNKDDAYYDAQGNLINMGEQIPFPFYMNYGMTQCIYLDKELQKKNISITGVQFIYDGRSEKTFTKPVKIYAQGTEWNSFPWNSQEIRVDFIDYDDPDWMLLYDGKVSFSGNEKNQRMVINFTEPYQYDGGNICFMYEKLVDEEEDDLPKMAEVCAFHYHDMYEDGEDLRQRTAKYSDKFNEYVIPDKVGTMSWIPFTMFAYNDGSESGILGVTADGLNFDLCGGKLTMSQVCDNITVYNMAGQVVAEANNTNTVSLGAAKGVFVIKATAGKKSVNCKVSMN